MRSCSRLVVCGWLALTACQAPEEDRSRAKQDPTPCSSEPLPQGVPADECEIPLVVPSAPGPVVDARALSGSRMLVGVDEGALTGLVIGGTWAKERDHSVLAVATRGYLYAPPGISRVSVLSDLWEGPKRVDEADTTLHHPDVESSLASWMVFADLDGLPGPELVFTPSDERSGGVWGFALPLPPGVLEVEEAASYRLVYPDGFSLPHYSGLAAGDVNGDGQDDLAVVTGEVNVYDGPLTGTVCHDDEDRLALELVSQVRYDRPVVPDTNCDGAADLLVKNSGFDPWPEETVDVWDVPGALYLYRDVGQPREISHEEWDAEILLTCDGFAYVEGPIGDVTGDGVVDVAALSSNLSPGGHDAGRGMAGGVYILSRLQDAYGTVSVMDVAGAILVGSEAGDRFAKVTPLGDLNGDGVDDLAVSAYSAGCCGKVYIFLGPLEGIVDAADADLVIEGSGLDGNLGVALATTDLDHDGLPDLAAGASIASWGGEGTGAVYVFTGAELLDAMGR